MTSQREGCSQSEQNPRFVQRAASNLKVQTKTKQSANQFARIRRKDLFLLSGWNGFNSVCVSRRTHGSHWSMSLDVNVTPRVTLSFFFFPFSILFVKYKFLIVLEAFLVRVLKQMNLPRFGMNRVLRNLHLTCCSPLKLKNVLQKMVLLFLFFVPFCPFICMASASLLPRTPFTMWDSDLFVLPASFAGCTMRRRH